MSLHTYLERMKRADMLISRKATGNVESLASKLNLSKSGTEKFIKEMKVVGFPISYNKKIKSYIYLQSGKMIDKLFAEDLDDIAMRKVIGGKNDFQVFSNRNYSRFSKNNFALGKKKSGFLKNIF